MFIFDLNLTVNMVFIIELFSIRNMDIIKKIRNYTLNERHCLGQGSFGKVYEATSDQGRKVAIKKVDQRLIISDRYLKESLDNQISIMKKLKHPNIVELYQVITTANNIYLVMEYCSGGDLKRYCMTRKVNEDMAYKILTQIVKGFEEMVKIGIIHRDLKPANVLVDRDTFKICDFGFAKLFGQTGKMAKTFVGTPIYMSPQVLSQKNYTNKTDVWSLGVMYYELLFKKLPFSGFSEQDLYKNIINKGLTIPQCSKQAQNLLKGMLVVDESNRWSWDDVFQILLGRTNPEPRRKAPGTNLFYQNEHKDKSYDNKPEGKKQYQNRQQPFHRTPKAHHNNFIDNNRQRGFDFNHVEREKGHDYNRKPQMGKNMLIPQQEEDSPGKNDVQVAPVHAQHKSPGQNDRKIENGRKNSEEQNPRFFYFILVQFLVNPLEGSLSFDSFLFTLWKHTLLLYEGILQKPEVFYPQLYKKILSNELSQLKNLEGQFQVKKEGNLRSLAQIVFQQSRTNPANKKKLTWLKRFIDNKYSTEIIQ